MRGRTNADYSNGVVLNATTDTYEVATGESILAGDFVEQYTTISGKLYNASSIVETTHSPYKNAKLFRMTDGNILCVGEKLNLYHDDNDVITKVWDEKNTSLLSLDFIIQLSDNCLLGDFTVNSESKLQATLLHYNTSDNTIVSKTLTSTNKIVEYSSGGSDNWVWVIPTSNGQYRAFAKAYQGTQDRAYIGTGLLNITGNNYSNYNVDLSSTVLRSDYIGESNKTDFVFVARIDANNNFLMKSNPNSSIFLHFNGESFTEFTMSSYPYRSFSGIGKLVYDNSTIDFFSVGSNLIRTYRAYINPTDPTNYNVIRSQESLISDSRNCNMRYITTQNNKDIYFVHDYIDDTIRVIRIDINTGNYEVLQSINVDTRNSTYTFIVSQIYNDSVYALLGNIFYKFRFVNLNLADISTSTKYVKRITTQDYIKGVAKQSGTAGQTIEVYIPSTSY